MSRDSVNKNAIYNTIRSVASILFPLITFPYVSRVLLPENVGKINFGLSVISYFSLIASLGIATYAIRECSKCRENKEQLSTIASEIYSLNIVTTLISYALLGFTLLLFSKFHEYRLLIIIQSLSIAFSTLGADWINNAMEDFKYITIRTLFFQILSFVLLLVFIHNPEDYIKYAIISLLSSCGAQLVNIIYRRKYCSIRFKKSVYWRKHIKPVLLLFSMQLAMVVYVNSDTTMLGIIRGDVEVGLYSVSVKIYNIVQTLVTGVQTVLIPQLAIGFANNDYSLVNKRLRYAFNFMLVLGLPCLVGINIVADGAIILLAGESYLGSVLSLRILMAALLASFMAGFLNNLIMLPSGRDKLCLVSSSISAILNIILNLILIPKYGLNAAAFTTFISMLAGFFIKLPFVDKRIKFDYIKKDVWSPIIACIIMTIVGYAVGLLIYNTITKTIVQVFICCVTYFIILLATKNSFLFELLAGIKNKLTGK